MQSLRNQHGSVIVWITLMIVLLLVMVGMGLDVGQLTYSRATGQPAVDASALAAASALPSRNSTTVQQRATAFNDTNVFTNSSNTTISATSITYVKYDWDSGNITAPVTITDANGVRVAMEAKNPYNDVATNTPIKGPLFLTPLLKLFGQSAPNTVDVSVSAVAVVTSVPTIPIVLWEGLCSGRPAGEKAENVEIKVQHPDKKDDDNSENACWTTFYDCSSGAKDIKALFKTSQTCAGSGTGVELGSEICQNRGSVTTSLKTAETFFFTDNQPGWWLVPVIQGGGNCDPNNPAKVINFAQIYPISIKDSGKDKHIKAHIICDPKLPQQIVAGNLCFSNRLVRDKVSGM